VLWKFRWYSILNQALIWLTVALLFGTLLERFLDGPRRKPVPGHAPEPETEHAPESEPVASGQS
jgi:hypothetical protein